MFDGKIHHTDRRVNLHFPMEKPMVFPWFSYGFPAFSQWSFKGPVVHPLITTLLANMGVSLELAPKVLLQLRPSDLDAGRRCRDVMT